MPPRKVSGGRAYYGGEEDGEGPRAACLISRPGEAASEGQGTPLAG